MQDITSMNKEMLEILSITKEKLGIFFNIELLKEINISLLHPSLNTKYIKSNIENCCKKYLKRFSKNNQFHFENEQKIFDQFMNLLIEVIENCASILHSLFVIEYPKYIKKKQMVSKKQSPSSNQSKCNKTSIKNIFPSLKNSQLFNSLFNKESKMFLAILMIAMYCCLSSESKIKAQLEIKHFLNIDCKPEKNFIKRFLKKIIKPLLELELVPVNSILSEEIIIEYISIISCQQNSKILIKLSDKFDIKMTIKILFKLYNKSANNSLEKQYFLNTLSFYSLKVSPTIFLDFVCSKYPELEHANNMAQKILINFPKSVQNEDTIRFVINSFSSVIKNKELNDTKKEYIILKYFVHLLQIFTRIALQELSKILFPFLHEIEMIDINTKRDRSIIYSHNSNYTDLSRKAIPYLSLNFEVSILLKLSKIILTPNLHLLKIMEDLFPTFLKLFSLLSKENSKDLSEFISNLKEIILFIYSNSLDIFYILKRNFYFILTKYKDDLEFFSKLVNSCVIKESNNINDKSECKTNKRIPIKKINQNDAILDTIINGENKKDSPKEGKIEINPQKIMIDIDNCYNEISIKFRSKNLESYLVDYFELNSVNYNLQAVEIVLNLFFDVPKQIQTKIIFLIFIDHLIKLRKIQTEMDNKKISKLNIYNFMIFLGLSNSNLNEIKSNFNSNIIKLEKNILQYRQIKNTISKYIIDHILKNFVEVLFEKFSELVKYFNLNLLSEAEIIQIIICQIVSKMLKSKYSNSHFLLEFLMKNKHLIKILSTSNNLKLAKIANKILPKITLDKSLSIESECLKEIEEHKNSVLILLPQICYKEIIKSKNKLIEIKDILNKIPSFPSNLIRKIILSLILNIKKVPEINFALLLIDTILELGLSHYEFIVRLILKDLNVHKPQDINYKDILDNLVVFNFRRSFYLNCLKKIIKRYKINSIILIQIITTIFSLIESSFEYLTIRKTCISFYCYLITYMKKHIPDEIPFYIKRLIQTCKTNSELIPSILQNLMQIINALKDKESIREEMINLIEKEIDSKDLDVKFSCKYIYQKMKFN